MVTVFIFSVTVTPTYTVISTICKPNAPWALKRSCILTHVSFPIQAHPLSGKLMLSSSDKKKSVDTGKVCNYLYLVSLYISWPHQRGFCDLYKCFVWNLGYVCSGYSRLCFFIKKICKTLYTLVAENLKKNISN